LLGLLAPGVGFGDAASPCLLGDLVFDCPALVGWQRAEHVEHVIGAHGRMRGAVNGRSPG
jgi:hypothetical protein